ncbi:MAG: hypothetical protein HQL53_11080 [Magnetococcales bacterium]|nr:hypothetical protein [Magnetococcales bacterium]
MPVYTNIKLAVGESIRLSGPGVVSVKASNSVAMASSAKGSMATGVGLSSSLGAMAGPFAGVVLLGCCIYFLVRQAHAGS